MSDMDVFDTLPLVVRDALQRTVRKWEARSALEALRQGVLPSTLAQYILRMDEEQAKKDNLYS